MLLIAIAQSVQNFDGLFHTGLTHHDWLETTFQGRIALNMLTVFI